MALLDDILGPSAAMLGPQGVQGTASVQNQPQPKKKTQQTPQTPVVAKMAPPPVDLSDNPFAQPAPAASPDLSGNPFAEAGTGGDAAVEKAHADFKSGALQRHEAAFNAVDRGEAQAASDADTYANRLGSMLEAPLSGVPGGALAMSVARKLTNGGTLAENQDAINRETDTARLSTPLKLVGGLASTALVPGMSGAGAGATLGALDQALNNDPNSGLGQRAARAVGGGIVGGAGGALLDRVLTGARSVLAPNTSAELAALKKVRADVDADAAGPSYATTAQQVARGTGTSPELQAVLAHPEIAPYADAIRSSELGKGMNDAEVGQEVYKQLGETQNMKAVRSANSGEYRAANSFDIRNAAALKNLVKQGLATVAPDFPEAVATHAEASQPITATRQGYDAAQQLMADRALAAKNLDNPTKDPLAFLRQTVPNMNDVQARAATVGALGRLRGTFEPTINPLKGFGVGPYLSNAGAVTPLLNALDQQGDVRGMDALRRAIFAYGQSRAATP